MNRYKFVNHKDFGEFTVNVRNSHWIDDGNGGGHRVYDDEPTARKVKLFIDLEAIVRQIGGCAIRSKSKKAKYMHGAIMVVA